MGKSKSKHRLGRGGGRTPESDVVERRNGGDACRNIKKSYVVASDRGHRKGKRRPEDPGVVKDQKVGKMNSVKRVADKINAENAR